MAYSVDPASSLSDYGNMGSTSTNVLSNISLPPYRPPLSNTQQQQPPQQPPQQQQQPSYFETRFGCGVNASPESALSPSISSVATSASEVSTLNYSYPYLISRRCSWTDVSTFCEWVLNGVQSYWIGMLYSIIWPTNLLSYIQQ